MNSSPLSETETVLTGKENLLPCWNDLQAFCCNKLSLKHNLPNNILSIKQLINFLIN